MFITYVCRGSPQSHLKLWSNYRYFYDLRMHFCTSALCTCTIYAACSVERTRASRLMIKYFVDTCALVTLERHTYISTIYMYICFRHIYQYLLHPDGGYYPSCTALMSLILFLKNIELTSAGANLFKLRVFEQAANAIHRPSPHPD